MQILTYTSQAEVMRTERRSKGDFCCSFSNSSTVPRAQIQSKPICPPPIPGRGGGRAERFARKSERETRVQGWASQTAGACQLTLPSKNTCSGISKFLGLELSAEALGLSLGCQLQAHRSHGKHGENELRPRDGD